MKKRYLAISLILVLCLIFAFTGCSNQEIKNEKTKPINYNIELELEDNNLKVNQTTSFKNYIKGENCYVDLNLYNQAFRENAKFTPFSQKEIEKAYYDGIDYTKLVFEKVKLNNFKTTYEIIGDDKNILRVKTNNILRVGTPLVLVLKYNLKIPKCIGRFGITPNAINLGNFYPSLCVFEKGNYYHCNYYNLGDVFYSEIADFDVTLKANEKYKVASSGSLENKVTKNGFSTMVYKGKNIRDFALVLSEKFNVLRKKLKDIEVFYYYFDDKSDTMKTITQCLNFYSEKFCDYPYKSYSVVITDFLQGGMEFSGLVYIAKDSGENLERTILHETAHQWWYSLVGSNAIELPYLDEGLTDFSSIYYYKKYNTLKYNEYIKLAYNQLNIIKKYEDNCLFRSLKTYSHNNDYYINCYVMGQIMYNFLFNIMGEQNFDKALKEYATKNAFKNVNFDNLINAFDNNCSGTKFIIEKWLIGEVIVS